MDPRNFLLILGILLGTRGEEDPCLQGNHKVLSYNGNYGGLTTASTQYTCDRPLDAGWYRLEPPENRTGDTTFPNWLYDFIPKNDGQVHTLTAYVSADPESMVEVLPIRAKNCSSFRVYDLTNAPGCPMDSCFANSDACPEGQNSQTGWPPGCSGNFYNLTQTPVVNFTVDQVSDSGDRREVLLTCDLPDKDSIPDDLMAEVTWFGGDMMVDTQWEVPVRSLPHRLREDYWSPAIPIGRDFTCRIRIVGGNYSVPSLPKTSEAFFVGIKVLDENIIVNEGETKEIRMLPTVPILCSNTPNCKLEAEVSVPKGDSDRCAKHKPKTDIVFEGTSCGVEFPGIGKGKDWVSEWQAIQASPAILYVQGSVSKQYAPAKYMKIKMKSAVFLTHRIWSEFEMKDIQVLVLDMSSGASLAQKMCYANNDPHMRTFDGCNYESQFEGEFILYRHKKYPQQVHTFLTKCNSYATCNRAVAVRAGKDVFIVDTTGSIQVKQKMHQSNRVGFLNCEDNLLRVQKQGNTYRVVMPSGTVVEIYHSYGALNARIYPSIKDLGQTEGLCGTFNKNRDDDFLHKGGTTPNPTRCVNSHSHEHHAFSKSWRIGRDINSGSLWNGLDGTYPEYKWQPYCTCEKNGTDLEPDSTCKFDESVAECEGKYKDVSTKFKGQCTFSRKKRSVDEDSDLPSLAAPPFQYDDMFVPPVSNWKNDWTEAKARDFCNKHILGTPTGERCAQYKNVDYDSSVDGCVDDIKLSGGTEWLGAAVNLMQSECANELESNTTRWVPIPGTNDTIPDPEIEDVLCPSNCSNNGQCSEGECVCNEGFTSDDCSIETRRPPTVYGVPGDGLCNTRTRPCQNTAVIGENYLDSHNLTCKVTVQEVTLDGSLPNRVTSYLPGEYMTSTQVLCPLHGGDQMTRMMQTHVVALKYTVTVSNDRMMYGDEDDMMVFDGLCNDCTMDPDSCTIKPATCRIAAQCYSANQTNQQYACSTCNPGNSQSQWTTQDPACAIDNVCYHEGTENPAISCEMCDPKTNSWVLKESHCKLKGECINKSDVKKCAEGLECSPPDWIQKVAKDCPNSDVRLTVLPWVVLLYSLLAFQLMI